jgi:hypothetical protein
MELAEIPYTDDAYTDSFHTFRSLVSAFRAYFSVRIQRYDGDADRVGVSDHTPALALLTLEGKNFGFLVLFAISGLARLLSAWYLSRVHDPPYHRRPSDDFSLLDFIRRAMKSCVETGVKGLHVFPPRYWEWPYSADRAEPRLLQPERDWIWFAVWARYSWNPYRDEKDEAASGRASWPGATDRRRRGPSCWRPTRCRPSAAVPRLLHQKKLCVQSGALYSTRLSLDCTVEECHIEKGRPRDVIRTKRTQNGNVSLDIACFGRGCGSGPVRRDQALMSTIHSYTNDQKILDMAQMEIAGMRKAASLELKRHVAELAVKLAEDQGDGQKAIIVRLYEVFGQACQARLQVAGLSSRWRR